MRAGYQAHPDLGPGWLWQNHPFGRVDPSKRRCVSWLSLDEADNDLTRFLTYFIAALQMLKADFGQALLAMLQSPQPPAIESLIDRPG